MRYRLTTQPTVGPGKVTEELERLLKNARRLTTSLVVVGPPYKKVPMTATVLEIPDAFAPMAARVLEVIQGPSGQAEPQLAVPMRAEWTRHALLLPGKDAQPLVESLFDGWSSACLHLVWRPGRCVGTIHFCASDAARVAALAARGWSVRPLPAALTGLLAPLSVGLAWTSRVSHQPLLGKPLITPTAQAAVALPGGKRMPAPTLFSEPQEQESVFARGAARQGARPTAAGTVLAPRGAEGFPLGVTRDGQAVALAWHALILSVSADEARRRDLALTTIARASDHAVGQIVVIPASFVSRRQLDAWPHVRALDPRNLWESQAVPWQRIDPALLREALAEAGVQAPAAQPLPGTFGELLAGLPGGDRYRTEAVLALTAPEGDDLRGVVAAGGGVLLLDDGSAGCRLLTLLLLALLATDPPADRRMLVIRPATLAVPAALAERAIQIVLGDDPHALGTLRALPDAWRLTHADGSPAVELDADLSRPPSAFDESNYGTLIRTLEGRGEEAAAPAALALTPQSPAAQPDADDDIDELFGTPFVTPRAAEPAEDELFNGSLDLADPFAAPAAAPVALPDAPVAASNPIAEEPADSHFGSFFAVPFAQDAADEPQAAGDPALDGDVSWSDVLGQPTDALALDTSGWETSQPLPAAVAPDDAATDDLWFDPLAAPLDLGSAQSGALDLGSAQSGALDPFGGGLDFSGSDSLFPAIAPWDASLLTGDDLTLLDPGLAQDDLLYLSSELDAPGIPGGARVVPHDYSGWSAEPAAVEAWSTTPWLPGDVTAAVFAPEAQAPQSDATPAAHADDAVPGEVEAAEATHQADRGWRVCRTLPGWFIARGYAAMAARANGAAADGLPKAPEPSGEADAMPLLDDVTLALTTGDLDLSAIPSFVGAEFDLSPVDAAADEPVALEADPAPMSLVGAEFDLSPVDAAAEEPAELLAPEEPAELRAEPAAPLFVDIEPLSLVDDEPAAPLFVDVEPLSLVDDEPAELLAADEPAELRAADEPAAPEAAEEPVELQAEPAAPSLPEVAPAVPALAAWAAPVVSAPVDLAIDPEAIYAAWGAGAGMADLVTLVARANPAADRSHIRRTIRALLDARPASTAAPPLSPVLPLWGMRAAPSFAKVAPVVAPVAHPTAPVELPAAPALLVEPVEAPVAQPVEPDGAAAAPALAPAAAPAADLEMPLLDAVSALALVEPVEEQPAAPAAATAADLETPLLDAESALTLVEPAEAPAVDIVPLLDASSCPPEEQPAAPARALVEPVEEQAPPARALVEPLETPARAAARRIDDEEIWARWTAGDELSAIVRAICGTGRGRAADEARERVARVVAPRLVAELRAELVVTRLLNGRNPLPKQVPLLDELLRRLSRQDRAPAGAARDETLARLLTSMSEAREAADVAA